MRKRGDQKKIGVKGRRFNDEQAQVVRTNNKICSKKRKCKT